MNRFNLIFELTKVGWASEDISEVLVPHNFVSAFLEVGFELLETIAESGEDSLHIAIFLHRNDSEMVFFVDPDKEVLLVVVPNTSRVGPISGLETCII